MTHPEVPQIRRASREMVRLLGLVGGDCDGLPTSHGHTLIEIGRLHEATAVQLSDLLCLDKSSLSRILTKLEQQDLITRLDHGGDKRQKPVTLTEQGRQRLQAVHRFADRPVTHALDLLRPEQRKRVQEGLQLYARALAKARAQEELVIRPIRQEDNPTVTAVIRRVLTEYDVNQVGIAYEDPDVDTMYEAYSKEGALYLVIEREGRLVGGGGIGPLPGGEAGQCELQKMYFLPELRGLGVGSLIIRRCLAFAIEKGYRICYLETLTTMERAQRLYRSFGFRPLEKPMGNTGHCSCDRWFIKDLVEEAVSA
ncbi:MAG: bifunctional helix-turn-helix transcriptional regulator/GNAT family N-acetyltransferase [Acidobacteriota bacterium]|nr:bifunctional helix-turn-helix transcriptional regulator/GNAT family N-acetyltransferase [Acidobacteriota bacterium]